MGDPDLYTRIRQGDKSACDECIRRHTPMVYGLALKLLGDTAEAEDACRKLF